MKDSEILLRIAQLLNDVVGSKGCSDEIACLERVASMLKDKAKGKHATTALEALEIMRGDDTARARHAFRGFTAEQMKQQHGSSGRTRAEILAAYEARDSRVEAAMEWVRSAALRR